MTGRMLKGAVALAALTGLLGAMVAGPAGAAAPVTKKLVKKIAKAQAKKYFNQNIGGATVTNATNASNADTVDGHSIQQISYRAVAPASGQILNFQGLTLRVACDAFGEEAVFAGTTESDGELSSISTDASNDDIKNVNDDTFNAGDDVDLAPAGPKNDRIYTIVYSRPGGGAVTVTLVTEDDIGANTCVASGYAIG